MKFRFRVLNSPKKLTASQSKKLRFAGKGGLRKIRPLPEPVEKINLNDTDFPKKKKKRLARSRLSGMFARIGKCLSRAFTAIGLRIKRVVNAISARLTARSKRKKIRSLPVLAGALTASVLVLTLTASCLLFGLFYRYARSYETVVIPSFTGKTPESADYDAEKFNLIIKYEINPDVSEGTVISQFPQANVTRKIYGGGFCDVRLTVSKSSYPSLPSGLVGMSLRDAVLLVLNSGFSYSVSEAHSSSDAGKVIHADTEGVTEYGDTVHITVSKGKKVQKITAPDLVGLTEAEAIARLRNAGLSVGQVTYSKSHLHAGTVISQTPAPLSELDRGAEVAFTVSAGEGYSSRLVPDLYGLSLDEARERLREVGLTLGNSYSSSSQAPKGTVISQSPLPNTPITSAITAVDIFVSS